MSDRSRYVFGAALAGVAFGGGVPGLVERASAAPVTAAGFTFETSYAGISSTGGNGATAASYTASSIGPLVAESGVGSAYGVHTSTATVYSSPAGNGSAHALSSNTWAVGDYYQFNVPTTSLTGIVVSFDQISSGTGPGQFNLLASADGTNFSTISGYTIPYVTYTFSTTSAASTAGYTSTGSSGFSAGASNSVFNMSFDLSALTALNNNSAVAFRLADAANAQYSSSAATVGTGGTDRVDNFVVSGTAAASVPEPATLALAAVAVTGLAARRRTRGND